MIDYPTEPSNQISNNFWASTANSIGNLFNTSTETVWWLKRWLFQLEFLVDYSRILGLPIFEVVASCSILPKHFYFRYKEKCVRHNYFPLTMSHIVKLQSVFGSCS